MTTAQPISVPALRAEFLKRYGCECRVFRAPGRVNLIGEHTDYNDGFVMPAAIDRATYVAVSEAGGGKLCIQSLQQPEIAEIPLAQLNAAKLGNWTDYVRGVAIQLDRAGVPLSGLNLLVDGNVPLGSGLSSSAALEVATATALLASSGTDMPSRKIAELCQRAENDFVGSRCGIMDQFISVHGRRGMLVLLDCRSLEASYLPLPAHVSLVICNTMEKHSLAQGEYNTRRAECEASVRFFAQYRKEIGSLRDVTENDLIQASGQLPELLLRRSRHVVSENGRVLASAAALRADDMTTFGALMYESHRSLREDYEVSCYELDLMVDLARTIPGTYGARMTGGGFGGCTINLVESTEACRFQEQIAGEYERETGVTPAIYITGAADGAGPVD